MYVILEIPVYFWWSRLSLPILEVRCRRHSRAFLMLMDEQGGELVPRVARGRDRTPAHGATISRTIAGTVWKDRVALMDDFAEELAVLGGAVAHKNHRLIVRIDDLPFAQ